jgi:hypothetical protein
MGLLIIGRLAGNDIGWRCERLAEAGEGWRTLA